MVLIIPHSGDNKLKIFEPEYAKGIEVRVNVVKIQSTNRLKYWKPALALIALSLGWQQAIASPDLIVETNKGPVKGITRNDVIEYRAFLTPHHLSDTYGGDRLKNMHLGKIIRDASSFGPACAQVTLLGVFAGPANHNEDCLYLNVTAPKTTSQEKLPVLFWIHGGGFVDGAASDYDASKLADQGKVIVVSINYRLSLLGFFAHPAISKGTSFFANYGLLDQQFALRWVKENIAKFGGDPNNITVAGQSAGGASVAYNVISPLAKDCFTRQLFKAVLLILPQFQWLSQKRKLSPSPMPPGVEQALMRQRRPACVTCQQINS